MGYDASVQFSGVGLLFVRVVLIVFNRCKRGESDEQSVTNSGNDNAKGSF